MDCNPHLETLLERHRRVGIRMHPVQRKTEAFLKLEWF